MMYCARVHQSTPRCGQFINPGIATFCAHRPRPSGWLRSHFWRRWWWQDCGPVLCHGCRRCDARKLGAGWIGHDKTIKDVKDSTLKILKMLKILIKCFGSAPLRDEALTRSPSPLASVLARGPHSFKKHCRPSNVPRRWCHVVSLGQVKLSSIATWCLKWTKI